MSSRSSVTKKACDGCKIRKIRCGGGHPCRACDNSRIKCTYLRVQQPRGPQRLRATTKYLIDQVQRELAVPPNQHLIELSQSSGTSISNKSPAVGRPKTTEPESYDLEKAEQNYSSFLPRPEIRLTEVRPRCRIPMKVLASPLYIYHVRMYPVWPIVDIENVLSCLQQDVAEVDLETYALATALAAATIAQLRLEQSALSNTPITADALAAESLRTRKSCGYRSAVNLNNVRTSFFLHIYYESQHSGGSESLLYLREAISLAQMMHLHREASYLALSPAEQRIRRRVLWLLFVTERGVCILHKLPVVLKTNISTPEMDVNDEPHVVPAFLKLLSLFRLFEQFKMFDVIENNSSEICSIPQEMRNLDKRSLTMLHDRLQDGSALMGHFSNVQKADLCVTRHWMRVILWKVSTKNHHFFPSQWPDSLLFPVMVAKDLLNIVCQLPRAAIEAHGLGMELKLYEIADSLADAVMNLATLPRAPVWDGDSRPSTILARLHSLLSTFRGGGNKELVEVLYKKMAEAQYRSGPALPPTIKAHHVQMKSKSLIGAPPSEKDLAARESPLHGPVHHIALPDWDVGEDPCCSVVVPPLPGPDWPMQGNLASVEGLPGYQICLDDMLACGVAPADSTGQGYAAFDTDPHGAEPKQQEEPPLGLEADARGGPSADPLFSSPWLPAYSMEKLPGNFVSQNTSGQFPSDSFLEDITNQEFPCQGFTI